MRSRKYTVVAALAFVGAFMVACSKGDILEDSKQSDNNDNIVTLTTTVGFEGDDVTKALSSLGAKTFAAGDQIAVSYTNTSDETGRAQSDALKSGRIKSNGSVAVFDVSLTNPKPYGAVTIIYPSAMANSDGSINYDALYSSQDGTLDSLTTTFDLATFNTVLTGDLEYSDNYFTLKNQLAILAITLKDKDGSHDITSSITSLLISDGTYKYYVNRTAAAGPIYVAVRPMNSATVSIVASDGTKRYMKVLTGKTYAKNTIHPVAWKISEVDVTLNLSNPSVGQLICNNGKNYNYGSVPSGVTALARICYLGDDYNFAFALDDESQMLSWDDAVSACASKNSDLYYAIAGATWKLPISTYFDVAIEVAGSNTSFRDCFSSVGGSNLKNTDFYWTASEFNLNKSRAFDYVILTSETYTVSKFHEGNVRAILQF